MPVPVCAPVPSVAINTRLVFDVEPCQGVPKVEVDIHRNGRVMAGLETIKKTKGLDEVDELRSDPNPQDPIPGDTNVAGDFTHAPTERTAPLLMRWFTNDWQQPTGGADLEGVDPALYSGVLKGGIIRTLCMEKGYMDQETPQFELFRGLAAKTFSGDFKATGLLKWKFGVVGMNSDAQSPTPYDTGGPNRDWEFGSKLHHAMINVNGIKIGGIAAGYALTGSWNSERTIVMEDRPVGLGGVLASVPSGKFTASGQVSARFADSDVLDVLQSGDPTSLELTWFITANRFVRLRWNRVFFEYTSPTKSKDGLLELSSTWHAAYDPTDLSAFYWAVASHFANSVDGDGTSEYEFPAALATGGIL